MGTNMLFYICKEILKIIMVENRVFMVAAISNLVIFYKFENKPHYVFSTFTFSFIKGLARKPSQGRNGPNYVIAR